MALFRIHNNPTVHRTVDEMRQIRKILALSD